MIYDAVVIGGGLIGASAALALHQAGMNGALLEAKAKIECNAPPDLRAIAVSYQNYAWLNTLGVVSAFDSNRTCAFDSMYLDEEHGAAHMILEASTLNRQYLGVIVDSHHIQATLQTQLQDKADCFYAERLVNLLKDADGYTVITDKRELKARVVLAADGGNSSIKSHLNINHDEHDYEQRAIVAYIHTEKPHDRAAWQRFLSTGTLALLPCSDIHTVSMVWTLPTAEAQAIQALSDNQLNEQLQAVLGDRLGQLQVTSERASFPIRAKHVHAYGASGVFLIGDAAHTIHPLAGLGANLGFSDVKTLVKILAETPQVYWMDPRIVARYQRERMHVNVTVSQLMSVLNYSMSKTGVFAKLRGWGMNAFNRMTPLKALSILYTDYI